LTAVALLVTALVYGLVALIVKADDVGVVLARQDSPTLQAVGRGLVRGMPPFLAALSVIGTVAMLWVGGGILLHGLYTLGVPAPERAALAVADAAAALVPVGGPLVAWAVFAALAAVVGAVVGWIAVQVVHLVTARTTKPASFTDF
jgi:hypothetical protein